MKKFESMEKKLSNTKGQRRGSFVLIVPIGGENVNVDFLFKDSIHQSMLLGNLTRPSVFGLSFERLRMTCAGSGVTGNLVEQLNRFSKTGRLISLQLCQTLLSFWSEGDFVHSQRELSQEFIALRSEKVLPSPRPICFSASSTLDMNSSCVISVGSATDLASQLTYLTNRLAKSSLCAITPKLCMNCAS